MNERSQVIPAQPGYYIVQILDYEDGKLEFAKIPIVAWVVTYQREEEDDVVQHPFATPVTFEGATYSRDPMKGLIIMDADGMLHDPFYGWWDSIESYEQYAREKHERERQKPENFD